MFSIFKKNKDNPKVPEWASFFSVNEFNHFLNAIEDYFSKKKIIYVLGDGMLSVKENDFGFNDMGLTNVAQVCKQDNPKNYRAIVFEHFESMIRANNFDLEFKKTIYEYDKIKQYIGVRLYPNGYAEHVGKELTIGKDFVGDIYAMLVFDLPDSITSIQPEQANKWGKSMDELFEIGLKNIKSNYPVEITKEKFDEFNIWFVQGDHFFAPNIVFDFNAMQKYAGSKGSLIGIPHRHSVIIYPIESLEVVKAINALIPGVYGMNEEGPGSISNNLFWYKDGHFENLPYEIQDNNLQFFPPEKFVELLNTLT